MNGEGGQGGFNPGRGGFNNGRGGFHARGGYGNGRGANGARGRLSQGGGRGGQGYAGGRGFQGNTNPGFGRNYVQGESSGMAGMNNGAGFREENWGGPRNSSSNFHNNNRSGYGNNQQRWISGNNVGRGGGYQNRFHGHGDGAARNTIDADLLQQTVQAVVAAVTAAQKNPESVGGVARNNAVSTNAASAVQSQSMVMPVAAPSDIQQQSAMLNKDAVEAQVAGANVKENEGPGSLKKKKEDKTACFRCKKPGHYIDDCTTPYCDICESIHHVSSACHLLQAPKPSAIIHGYANEALMFFELPCGAFKAKVENPKMAKVTVDGDVMTIPEIIEQLKRIVPYEKFHWEVFHYKDNIYRVKLPSKQEVQRLKNFGTYICPERETCLSFDLWSSLEEPLYMLPEVWVRVSGLPSDMRADYLSLWGVGSLFGKTLDVDMAFTRKNKVLRINIGCLDRNLIPVDSDVFIRRGFFKLIFEVEAANGSQEVNMVDANNGNDGGGDAHNGEGNNAGGNAMDMDTKGADDDATSNNNGQDVPNTRNGVEGMQEQCQHVEEIQIGTMKVQLSPADSGSSRSAPGLPTVGPREARLGAVSALLRRPAAPAAPLSADRVHVQDRRASSNMQPGSQSGLDTRQQASGGAGGPGSSAPGTFSLNEQLCSVSQKILPAAGAGPALGEEAKGNHWPMMSIDGQSLLPDADAAVGSSVHAQCVANEGKDGDESMRHREEGLSTNGKLLPVSSDPLFTDGENRA
ncbi:hypothetical protein ACQ4PT_024038 [Festuca glaucescens]